MSDGARLPDLGAADAVFDASVLATRVVHDRPLGLLTTYRVGGSAARFVTVESMIDLRLAVQAATAGALPVLVIGRAAFDARRAGGQAG